MLPAGRGDCLFVEYGEASAPHAVLIDGGFSKSVAAVRERLRANPRLELLVVTHIDLDHISGTLGLLRRPPAGLRVGDVWFNGWDQLPEDPGVLGAPEGEKLSELIGRRGYPWNQAFNGGPVAADPGKGRFPVVSLPGGLTLTILGPTRRRLVTLRGVWKRVIESRGLQPGSAGKVLEKPDEPAADEGVLGEEAPDVKTLLAEPEEEDRSVENGSSLIFLAECGGKSCLFTGDAIAADVAAAASALAKARKTPWLEVDALKLSHHGGRKNTSRALLDALSCRNFLFSSDGTINGHPHPESVARVIAYGRKRGRPRLHFNYRSGPTEVWDSLTAPTRRPYSYEPLYPDDPAKGLTVDL